LIGMAALLVVLKFAHEIPSSEHIRTDLDRQPPHAENPYSASICLARDC
jgi:hypothetical protein